jgi:hypothetical protein
MRIYKDSDGAIREAGSEPYEAEVVVLADEIQGITERLAAEDGPGEFAGAILRAGYRRGAFA